MSSDHTPVIALVTSHLTEKEIPALLHNKRTHWFKSQEMVEQELLLNHQVNSEEEIVVEHVITLRSSLAFDTTF